MFIASFVVQRKHSVDQGISLALRTRAHGGEEVAEDAYFGSYKNLIFDLLILLWILPSVNFSTFSLQPMLL